jgi:predicted GNAT family N-acyltransferase
MAEPNMPESTTTLRNPSDCSNEELRAFCALGGEVAAEGLLGLVKRAKTLAFRYEGDKLVGVAALKNPSPRYRREVFQDADAKLDAGTFPLELGWVVVDDQHKRKKHSLAVVESLLSDASTNIYATSSTANEPMHKGLRRFGFTATGKAYPSKEHEGQEVALFVRARPDDK